MAKRQNSKLLWSVIALAIELCKGTADMATVFLNIYFRAIDWQILLTGRICSKKEQILPLKTSLLLNLRKISSENSQCGLKKTKKKEKNPFYTKLPQKKIGPSLLKLVICMNMLISG